MVFGKALTDSARVSSASTWKFVPSSLTHLLVKDDLLYQLYAQGISIDREGQQSYRAVQIVFAS